MEDVLKKEELLEKINDALLLVKNDVESGNNKPYKFEVGAAMINKEGVLLEEEIKDESVLHWQLFKKFANIFGVTIESFNLYDVAIEACESGLVVEQVLWESISFYLPKDITIKQIDRLIEEIVHRPNYTYEIYHNEEILDECSHSYDVLNYLGDYIENELNTDLSTKAV